MNIHSHLLDFLNPIIGAWMSREESTFTRSRRLLEPGQRVGHDRFSVEPTTTENGHRMRIRFIFRLPAMRLGNQQISRHRDNGAGKWANLVKENGCDADPCTDRL